MRTTDPELRDRLRTVFGHDGLRPGQAQVIDHVLAGEPTLGIMPTGAGKSLCYQLPAVLLPGITVVVSPLIALMQDQVQQLRRRGISAASLTSAEDPRSQSDILSALRCGQLTLLYVAPERFRSLRFVETLRATSLSLLAIDEAHCISEWGHDFRPEYARLGEIVQQLAPKRFVALTATATPDVRKDVLDVLRLPKARVVVTGFDRPNLALSVEFGRRHQEKLEIATDGLRRWMGQDGSALVYAGTRSHCETLAEALCANGFRAEAYHAGLAASARAAAQAHFEQGSRRVMVATSAFGMGVDKRDVRVVVHVHLPSSPEAYYQEVGRAGRDGQPAAGILAYDHSDLRDAHRRLSASCPSLETLREALAGLLENESLLLRPFDNVVETLRPRAGPATRAALINLDQCGDISMIEGRVRRREVTANAALLERRAQAARARLDAMIAYVHRSGCRRRRLVEYFGDESTPVRCGACDRCVGPARASRPDVTAEALRKILECLAELHGQYGRTRVCEVLVGARSPAVTRGRLEGLETYGRLSDWDLGAVLALLDALIAAGYARTVGAEYPRVALTRKGAAAMRAKALPEVPLWLGNPPPPTPTEARITAHPRTRGKGRPQAQRARP